MVVDSCQEELEVPALAPFRAPITVPNVLSSVGYGIQSTLEKHLTELVNLLEQSRSSDVSLRYMRSRSYIYIYI
jgi:hypothetical protein